MKRTGCCELAIAVLAICLAVAPACRRAADRAGATEVQRVRSGALDVVLLSPHQALTHGKDAFFLEFRSIDGKLVDVGDVRGSATMPMPGMPMMGAMTVARTNVPGRYTATSDFEMAGTWRLTVQWQGPAGPGSVSFAAQIR
jgi:YtkA-like protein